jgi:hypothetical protein
MVTDRLNQVTVTDHLTQVTVTDRLNQVTVTDHLTQVTVMDRPTQVTVTDTAEIDSISISESAANDVVNERRKRVCATRHATT